VNKKLLAVIGAVIGVLLAVAAVVMFIMCIWIPDERWAQTGGILLATALTVGLAFVVANA
jgi:protein-S-isoprenylcysteine O-methyltransferase Ste14